MRKGDGIPSPLFLKIAAAAVSTAWTAAGCFDIFTPAEAVTDAVDQGRQTKKPVSAVESQEKEGQGWQQHQRDPPNHYRLMVLTPTEDPVDLVTDEKDPGQDQQDQVQAKTVKIGIPEDQYQESGEGQTCTIYGGKSPLVVAVKFRIPG